jgi:hypothetical protein
MIRAADERTPQVLEVNRLRFSDSVDVWYSLSMARRPLKIKALMRTVSRAISRVTRSAFMPDLNLAIQKSVL